MIGMVSRHLFLLVLEGNYELFWLGEVCIAAERREKAAKKIKQLQKKGVTLEPINIPGRTIAKTYWVKLGVLI